MFMMNRKRKRIIKENINTTKTYSPLKSTQKIRLKIVFPKQMLERLLILLGKVGNIPKYLLNVIRQIGYSLY